MTALRTLLARLRGLLARRPGERDFSEEIEAHLGLLTERFVREGMRPDDARRAARRQFGNVTSLHEVHRELRGFAVLQVFGRDLRQGGRLLRRNPGWTVVAVLTLALGIGANTAIFGLVRPILLRPLPYPDPDALVVPCTTFQRWNTDRGSSSYADILDWRGQRDLFARVAAYNSSTADITDGDEPERVPALLVEPEYFAVMGTSPLLGRFFTAEENLPNGPPVTVLSHALWLRRFGGDPAVVGRQVAIRDVPTTIVGVARPGSTWPSDALLFVPLGTGGQPEANMLRRDNHAYRALARLQPGATIAQAQARLTVLGTGIAERETNRAGTSWKLYGLAAFIVGPTLPQTLAILLGAALLVLLIACVNVANLLLARGVARQHEIAVRAALGASRGRIAAQFLVESAALSAAGGIAGVVVGHWGLRALVRFAPPDIPRIESAHVDGWVLLFSLGLCAVATMVAGLLPAVQATRALPGQSFREGGRGVAGGTRTARLHGLLVVVEMALAVVVLTGAGLLLRSFSRIASVDPGVSAHRVLTLRLSLPRARYAGAPQITDGFGRLLDAIRGAPGVEAASATSSLPLGGGGFYLGRVFLREDQPEPPASADTPGAWCVVRPGYFEAIGIPVVEGRGFTPRDRADSTPVAIVSQSMAKAMFPDGKVLGRRIRSWRDENRYREIVGVVADVPNDGLTDGPGRNVYVAHAQNPWRSLTLVVRASGAPGTLVGPVRAAIWSVDPRLPLAEVQTLDDVMNQNMARPRFSMFLLVIFGAIAVVLAAVGIYGVIAYAVTQRTREIGIRIALGALRLRVVAAVTWNALRLALAGVAGGVAAAFGLTRLLGALLFEVSPTDAPTFAAASALLLAVAVAAGAVPAWRAARIDPVTTLRYE